VATCAALISLAAFPVDAAGQETSAGVVPTQEAYLTDQPEDGDSSIRRWLPATTGVRTIRVAFEPSARPDTKRQTIVRDALAAWSELPGVPIRFRFVEPNMQHDVVVRSIEQFSTPRAGVTAWDADDAGWIRTATVTLAVRHHDGLPMGDDFFRFVALHEFGHLLGLPHSGDPRDVMHPGNRNAHLSGRDVRSAQALYDLTATAGSGEL